MNTVPFGVSQYTTWPLTFEQDIKLFGEAGIEYIEVCEAKLDAADPEPQLKMIKDAGMKVSSVQPKLHSLFPDLPRPEPKAPADRMARLRKTIELFGRHFPGTTVVSITGCVPNGDYDLGYRTAAQQYKEMAKVAGNSGVKLAVEPLSPVLMNVDTFICTIPHAARVVESVDHPAFGWFLDVWHVWEENNAPELIQKYGDKIFGVHVNDWRDPRAFGDRVLPGEGVIPLVPLLQAVRKTSYAGAYTLEVFSETRLAGSLWTDPRRTVIEGKKAFAKTWDQACG